MMDEAMKLAGLHYLHNTLRSSLDLVFRERKPCEIDPARVRDLAMIETNLTNLKEYVENIFQAITTSALHCPSLMCQMFHDLKELASTCFPGESSQDKWSNMCILKMLSWSGMFLLFSDTFIGLSLCKCWQPFI
jgi:hypothetical protein